MAVPAYVGRHSAATEGRDEIIGGGNLCSALLQRRTSHAAAESESGSRADGGYRINHRNTEEDRDKQGQSDIIAC